MSLFDTHLLPVSVASPPNLTRPQSRWYPDIFDRMNLFLDRRLGRRSIYYILRSSTFLFDHKISTLFHCSMMQTLCMFAHWSLLTLFCFLKSGFMRAILLYNLASQYYPRWGCAHLFSWHWFSCARKFGEDRPLSCKLVTLIKLFSSLVVAFGLTAQRLVLFYPVSWCPLTV